MAKRIVTITGLSFLLLSALPFPAFCQFGGGGGFVGGPSSGGSSAGSFSGGGNHSGGFSSGGFSEGFGSSSDSSNSGFTSPGSNAGANGSGFPTVSAPTGTGESGSGTLTIGDRALIIGPSSSQAGAIGAVPLNLTVDERISVGLVDIYSAEGQTVLVDAETRTFSNLGMPFGETLNIEGLSRGIDRISTSYLGKALYGGDSDRVLRALISLSSERAASVALALSNYSGSIPDRMVGPIFLILATAEPKSLSKGKDMDQQIGSLIRLLDLSPNAYTPHPDDPDGNDPTLPPPFPIPSTGRPIVDPVTGLPLPWLPVVRPIEKQEKAREEEQRKLEEMMADMTVNIVGPHWLLDMVPNKDPNVASEVNLRADSQGQAIATLESWCTTSIDPAVAGVELESRNADILIFENLEEMIRSNPEINKCMTQQGLVQPKVMQHLLAFDGAVPLTRMRFDASWTPGHLAAALAGLHRPDFVESAVPVPKETVLIEPRRTSCKCVEGDPRSWSNKLLSGWLVEGSELWKPQNCRSPWEKDPQVTCAGNLVEIAPPVEASLTSLAAGAPDPTTDLKALDSSSTTLDQDHLCAIDAKLACITYRTRTTLKANDFLRVFRRLCDAGFPEHPECKNLSLNRQTELYTNAQSLFVAQREDLLEKDGTGVFLLPLRTVLLDNPVDTNGEINTHILKDVAQDSVPPLRLKALQMRERDFPFRVIPFAGGNLQQSNSLIQSLLSEENPYVRRVSIVVHHDLLSQIAIRSYFQHLTQEWAPTNTSTLVSLKELKNDRAATTSAPQVSLPAAYDLAPLLSLAPIDPLADSEICGNLIARVGAYSSSSEKLLARASLMTMGTRCARSIESFFRLADASKEGGWREALSKDMLLVLAYVSGEDSRLRARLAELGELDHPETSGSAGIALPRSEPFTIETPAECPNLTGDADYTSQVTWEQVLEVIEKAPLNRFVSFFQGDAELVLQSECLILPLAKHATPELLKHLSYDLGGRNEAAWAVIGRVLGHVARTRSELRPSAVEIVKELLTQAGREQDYLRDRQLVIASEAIVGLKEHRALVADALASSLIGLRPADKNEDNIWFTCDLLGALGPYSKNANFMKAAADHINALGEMLGADSYLLERCLAYFVDGLVQSNYSGDLGIDLIEHLLDAYDQIGKTPPTGYDSRLNVLLAHLRQHGGPRAISLLVRYMKAGQRDAVKALTEIGADARSALPSILERLATIVDRGGEDESPELAAAALAIGGWPSLQDLSEQFQTSDRAEWESALAALETAPGNNALTLANILAEVTYSQRGPDWRGTLARLLGDLGAPAVDVVSALHRSQDRGVQYNAYLALAQILADETGPGRTILTLLEDDPDVSAFCRADGVLATDSPLVGQDGMAQISLIRTICKPKEVFGRRL
ncbi:hypothetical protein E0H71_00345 [Rhizobium leguminosarum bv. viciae]|uniref:hypothetical protein n=1 Tax=Rhizobium leguminosarum TaxID=384 RepID=UPI00103F2FC0|nr:hypothetical protein [Rhizobium leguminosarum]TCA58086.1 hypothetical protein E0H71_00345 [Rhizobium leguminosarum bv. viciae]